MSDENAPRYREAGVDIAQGDLASNVARVLAEYTYRPEVEVTNGVPGFLFDPSKYQVPKFLGSTDGVGTKLKLAFEMQKFDTVGIDLVAMCVNDLLRYGAEPLMFLDYIATSKLDVTVVQQIMKGIAVGCKQAGCSLLGGETAEMPGFYSSGEFDLAGTAFGVVEADKLITGNNLRPGDVLIGIPSSGLHSNGFSLVRQFLSHHFDLYEPVWELGNQTLGEVVLTPTRIYKRDLLPLFEYGVEIHGIAHITGSGLFGKTNKMLPEGLGAAFFRDSWTIHPIFDLIQQMENVTEEEMLHTFNMGLGMVIGAPPRPANEILSELEDGVLIGEIYQGPTQLF